MPLPLLYVYLVVQVLDVEGCHQEQALRLPFYNRTLRGSLQQDPGDGVEEALEQVLAPRVLNAAKIIG